MGLTAKSTGKLRGMLYKIELDNLKRKEELNHAKNGKSQKKETD